MGTCHITDIYYVFWPFFGEGIREGLDSKATWHTFCVAVMNHVFIASQFLQNMSSEHHAACSMFRCLPEETFHKMPHMPCSTQQSHTVHKLHA